MEVSVIIIGDELLIGQVSDVNSAMISRAIAPAGWQVKKITVVGDSASQIKDAIESSLSQTDVVLTTGGLGPTKDDITKTVLTEVFGGQLVEDSSVLKNVEEICSKRNIVLNELTRQQAIVPDSCTVIQNKVGTAPLMWFERNGKVLVAMPGVPFETKEMFVTDVFPRLLEKFGKGGVIAHRVIQIFGVIESEIARRLEKFENNLPDELHLAYLPTPGLVRLRLDGFSNDADDLNYKLDKAFNEIKAEFGDHVLWEDDLSLPEILQKLLLEKGYTIATAESCTGGNIAHTITSIPGSSAVFQGSVVAYQNEIKHRLLGVDSETLEKYGAVSLPVAEQMANGVAELIGTDCAIATSGIAGPGGAVAGKPVGTVCISVKIPGATFVDHFHFPGDRSRVIQRSTNTALVKMIAVLRGIFHAKVS